MPFDLYRFKGEQIGAHYAERLIYLSRKVEPYR